MLDSLYAVIVPNLEYFQLKNEKNIRAKLRWELENLSKNLPSFKHITGFTLIKEELPRTRLKKIKRYEVAQKYLKEDILPQEIKKTIICEEDLKILDTDVAKKVINYLSSELKKPVYLDSHLEIDLGIDSLSRVELGLGLEALLSLKIPDEVIDSTYTVKDVIVKMQDIINQVTFGIYEPSAYAEAPGESKEEQKSWNQILNELPCDKILEKIKLTISFSDKIIIFIFKNILLFNFRIFWLLKIKGKEFIPCRGPYIICPNHASYLDGFFLFGSLTSSCAINTFFIGQAAIFEHPLVRWAMKLAHLISIDPSVYLIEAMQASSYVLRHNKIICIFPEGARSISEEIGEFKKGIGILMKELNIPVIPVYIKGSHFSWPRGVRFPRIYPIKIIFGKPLTWQELGSDYEAITERLRNEVLKLAGQK
jgi:long-chain acyl-CoA synthetase